MDNPSDTLTIPLTSYINKTVHQNKLTGVRGLFILVGAFLPFIVYALAIGMFSPQVKTGQFFFGCVLFGLTLFLVILTFMNARKTIRSVDAGAPKIIMLNDAGIELPKFLLNSSSLPDGIKPDEFTVKIAWKEIASWHVIDAPFFNSKNIPPHYLITLAAKPIDSAINVLRVLPSEEEEDLLDFAQRFLANPIKVQKSLGYKDRKLA